MELRCILTDNIINQLHRFWVNTLVAMSSAPVTHTHDFLKFESHPLLTRDECLQIWDKVISDRDHWTPRGHVSFFTLGAASYIDAAFQHAAYLRAAEKGNAVLQADFSAAPGTRPRVYREAGGDEGLV